MTLIMDAPILNQGAVEGRRAEGGGRDAGVV